MAHVYPCNNSAHLKTQKCGVTIEKQKKTRKCATMKQMLSLRDQRLKEKDRLKPKKKGKKDPSTWVHLTTSSLIPTLSTFP
uniref:Uncharacterized protein n=1 Tax=Saimiri boliviensis boliviensis TaxID=39432 RepID=A0A2K6UJ31_SAIBB